MPNIKKFGHKQVTAGHRPTLGHKRVSTAGTGRRLGHKAVGPTAGSNGGGITAGPPGVNPQVPFAGVPQSKLKGRVVVPTAGVPPGCQRVDKRIPLGKYAYNMKTLQGNYRDKYPFIPPQRPSRTVQRFVTQNTLYGIPLQQL